MLLVQYKIDFVSVPNETVAVQNQYKFGTMLNEVEYSRTMVTNGIGSAQCYYWYRVVPENILAPQQKTL